MVTVAGLQLGYLFGSIIVIESLFNYTGMGWLTYQALLNRDMPLIQATVFVIAAVVMLANLRSTCSISCSTRASGWGDVVRGFLHAQGPDRLGLVIVRVLVAICSPRSSSRPSSATAMRHARPAQAADAGAHRSAPTSSGATCSTA